METERQLQDQFDAWLRERKIPFIRSRMDKRPTIRLGWPDFSVFFMGRCVFIETKTADGKLSDAQKQTIAFLRLSGNRVEVARTLAECIEAAQTVLCDGKCYSGPAGGCNYPLEPCFQQLKQAVEHAGEEVSRSGEVEFFPEAGTAAVFTGPRISKGGVNDEPTNLRPNPPKPQSPSPVNGNFYIGDWQGTQYVFARNQDDKYSMIRQASGVDVLNWPKLPK